VKPRIEELAYQGGFAGPPIPPNMTGKACPAWNNVRLDPSGQVLMPLPGYKRSLLSNYSVTDGDNLQIWDVDPQVIGMKTGQFFLVVDGKTQNVMGMAYNGQASTPRVDQAPNLIGYLERHSIRDFIQPLVVGPKTFFFSDFALPRVHDGAGLRMMGLRPPQIAPTITKTVASSTEVSAPNEAATWTKPAGLDANTAVTIADESDTGFLYGSGPYFPSTGGSPDPADYLHIKLSKNDRGDAAKNLAYIDTAGTLTEDTIKLKMRVCNDNGDISIAGSRQVPGWTLIQVFPPIYAPTTTTEEILAATTPIQILFATGTGLTGTVTAIDVQGPFPPGQWIEKTIQTNLNGGSVTYASIGIRRKDIITKYRFHDDYISFSFEDIVTQVPTVTSEIEEGDYLFGFTWFRSVANGEPIESGLSPISQPIHLLDGEGANIDITGWYAGIVTDMPNKPPNDLLNFVSIVTSGSYSDATRTLTKAGAFTRIQVGDLLYLNDAGSGKIVDGYYAVATRTDDAVTFSVDVTSANQDATDVTATAAISIADRVRIYVHRLADGVDQYGMPLFHLLLEESIGSGSTDGTGGANLYSFSTTQDWLTIQGAPGPPWENGPPPSAYIPFSDGNRTLLAGQRDYSVGVASFTLDSNIVTFVATGDPLSTPRWLPSMEGRQIRFGEDSSLYLIVKVLDQDDDGVYDALYVAKGEKLDTPVTLATDTAGYTIYGKSNRLWFSVLSSRTGMQREQFGPFNYKDLDMPGDEITGLARVGDFTMVTGARHPYVMLQNQTILDDIPVGAVYPDVRLLQGGLGCIASRSMVNMPDRSVIYLGEGNNIVLANSESTVIHPLSNRVKGYLSGFFRVDTFSIPYAHAVYDPSHNWYCLFFVNAPTSPPTYYVSEHQLWDRWFGEIPGFLTEGMTDAESEYYGQFYESSEKYGLNRYQSSDEMLEPYGIAGQAQSLQFDKMVVIDLNQNMIYVGEGWRISCTLPVCIGTGGFGKEPNRVFGGDSATCIANDTSSGKFVNRILAEDAMGQGSPLNRVAYQVLSVTPNATDYDIFLYAVSVGAGRLPDNGQLLNIPIYWLDGDTARRLTFVTNDQSLIRMTSTVAIGGVLYDNADPTTYPAVGDTILIGPMECGVVFRERRFVKPATLRRVMPDIKFLPIPPNGLSASPLVDTNFYHGWNHDSQGEFYIEPLIRFQCYGPSQANGQFCSPGRTDPVDTRYFAPSDLYSGDGTIYPVGLNHKAAMLSFQWYNVGPFWLGPIYAEFQVDDAEPAGGRSKWL